MSLADVDLIGLREIDPEAHLFSEGGKEYIHLPVLKVPIDGVLIDVEGLLCPVEHSGYATRLFLSQPVPSKGQNWTVHNILGRSWHTWSWNGIPASLSLTQILLGHLRALR